MFELATTRVRKSSLFASFLAHFLLLYVCLNRTPVFIKPSTMAWGQHGRSDVLIYFPQATNSVAEARKHPLHFKKKEKRLAKPSPNLVESARAGTPQGSTFSGPQAGREARPAIPVLFPDPPILAWQLPQGRQGDVVIEITIDQRGTVTATRILQSFVPEIDAKVMAAVRGWRFQPATVDGAAVSSRQDVHFHFPG
ncbi:MAG: TonB family protein [Acidobacteria bacterium]|nr:TonB family protein [Acidobacteriota bacterium]